MRGAAVSPRERAEAWALAFRGQANNLAFAYGGPLYLVGSMLTSPSPADIDLRLLIERADLDLWFGADWDGIGSDWNAASLARCREELKQSRRMTRRWARRPNSNHVPFGARRIDFQFQTALFSDETGEPIQDERPRLRLDAVPFDMLRAGKGEP